MSVREREIEMFTGSENSSVINTILFSISEAHNVLFYSILYV